MKAEEEIISRKSIKEPLYREILDVEKHHDHEIVKDDEGILRWRKDDAVSSILENKMDLNDLMNLFHALGCSKNSEIVRKLYRDMGYSLGGYWAIFYWEVNNEEAKEYVPNTR